MQAIILAAGMGKRLGNLTLNNTKCMVKVHNKTLIERMLDTLANAEVSQVVLVVGYKGENVKSLVGHHYKGMKIIYVWNDLYETTNNIYSLFLARKYLLEDDTLLLESDIIFEEKIIYDVVEDPRPTLALVAQYQSWMDGTVVTLDDDDNILRFVPKKDFLFDEAQNYFKTINIYKLSKAFSTNSFIPFLKAYQMAMGKNEYYEQVLKVITALETQELKVLRINSEKWYEIDDKKDLDNASAIFAPKGQRLQLYQKRFGGFWRFPFLKDFCYLVNPYFPPDSLRAEMKYYFDDLLEQYPSGMGMQNLLAAGLFDCEPNEIIVGNGASELINTIVDFISGKVCVTFPTFDEYPERFGKDNVQIFIPENDNFTYSIEELKKASEDCKAVVLINPDNPSGHFIPREEVLALSDFLHQREQLLILDESFVDFASGGPENSLIASDILQHRPNLIIIKSISKSYGVPGIRLGVMATCHAALMASVKKRISIWNINSFGEFFLQVYGKYRNDYRQACLKTTTERDRFFSDLKKIKFLRAIPSQGNYFLCEVTKKFSATELTTRLLEDHEILIKDCTGKTGFEGKNFVRIAVRERADNSFLVKRLKTM
jgi:histidinol-phosphate/aromatic aminotransferase/cobyric acid decarboxylase-like protein/choline kinase